MPKNHVKYDTLLLQGLMSELCTHVGCQRGLGLHACPEAWKPRYYDRYINQPVKIIEVTVYGAQK